MLIINMNTADYFNGEIKFRQISPYRELRYQRRIFTEIRASLYDGNESRSKENNSLLSSCYRGKTPLRILQLLPFNAKTAKNFLVSRIPPRKMFSAALRSAVAAPMIKTTRRNLIARIRSGRSRIFHLVYHLKKCASRSARRRENPTRGFYRYTQLYQYLVFFHRTRNYMS